MQSFRQNKQFRRALELQVERDKEKAKALANGNKTQPPPPPEDEYRDSEKAENHGSYSSSDTRNTAVGDHAPFQHAASQEPQLAREQAERTRHHPTEEVEEAEKEEEYESPEEDNEVPESLEHRPSNLHREATQRSTGQSGLANMGTHLGTVMTGVNIRKRNTQEGGDGDVFIVGYEGDDDPQNPHNWSMLLRIFITIMVASIGFVVGVASSIDSSATMEAAMEFHVSEVVEVMATGEFDTRLCEAMTC